MRKNNFLFLFVSIIIATLIVSGFYFYKQFTYNLVYTADYNPIAFVVNAKNYEEKYVYEYNPDIQQKLDVLNYDIDIELNPQEKKIKAKTIITIKLNDENLTTIPLNFYNNLIIDSIKVNKKDVKYKREDKLIYLLLENKIDTAIVEIKYRGTPKNLGFGSFVFTEKEKYPLVYTMNEPVFASTWLPCVDRPNDKALMQIKITNDSALTSLSNGKLISVIKRGNKKTFTWKTFYPISTYLIAIYSGKYISKEVKTNSITNDEINLSYYLFPLDYEKGLTDFADHPDYINTFEKLFAPYPFTKEKYSVAEFLWQDGAMEHQTITGIGSNFITGKKFFSDMLIHELAHHWWGDAVSPKSWKDIWLNEGFATYSEALYWERKAGYDALKSTLQSKFSSFDTGTLYNPAGELFTRLIYDKGAWVLHMLRKEIGDSKFFESLKLYFNTYKYSNASTKDFQLVCEKISGRKLDYFFDQWIYKGEGIINLAYDWNYDLANKKLVINFEQQQKGFEIYKFPIDIAIDFGNGKRIFKNVYIDKKSQRINIDINETPQKIELDSNKWLLAKYESRNDE